jgi:exonuclease VII small subunit
MEAVELLKRVPLFADLDDAIKLWERGEELNRFCLEQLDSAQGKIEALRPSEPA